MVDSGIRVGVLSLHDSKETKAILNAVEALGATPEWLRKENTVFRVVDGRITLDPDVDIVANRLLLSNTDQPSEDIGVAQMVAGLRPTLNHPDAAARALHKLAAAAALAEAGIPIPDTAFALSGEQLNRLRDEFGPGAVYKTAIGTHGGGAWRVEDETTLNAKVGTRRAFLQQFVSPNGGRPRDLRVYVVGERVVGAMFRYAAEGDWRTNVARGGDVENATETVDPAALDLATRAADVVGLDYAGVDLIEGRHGWYVLEVNPTAGFRGLYKATGRSPAPYIAKLAIERAGGVVDEEQVRELSATLDDSVPSCRPQPETTSFEEPIVIGLTERVVVSGTTGTRTVVGKSDTGAARTSIDLRLAADIGAGPIHNVSRVRSGGLERSRSRPVVDLVVGIGGTQHTVAANIEDRSHLRHPVLIGRDILQNYHLDVSRQAGDGDHMQTIADEE